MDDTVEPVGGVSPTEPVSHHGGTGGSLGGQRKGVRGQVVAIHRRNAHHDGEHRLDVSIGAEEHTEVVVRVESDDCAHLDGKRVIVFLDE